MKIDTKIIISVAVVVAIIAIVSGYIFLNTAFAPLEQKEETKSIPILPGQDVKILASTFNGNVELQTTTNNSIEINYKLETPNGHLNEVTGITSEKNSSSSLMIIDAQGKLVNSNEGLVANHKVNIIIKLPLTSKYSLNLTSLNGNIIKPQLNDTTIIASTNNGKIEITDDKATAITAVSQNGNINIHLPEGTLFHVDANTANGHVTYQGIPLNVSTQTGTQLIGNTAGGQGNLNLILSSANGIVTIEYFNK